jgi:4a-hydroxytetrahydrobiopterin dehydratase
MPSETPLAGRTCRPCEGGVPVLTSAQINHLLPSVPGWTLTPDGKRIRREWTAKNFMSAITFFNAVAALAESEGHHPDLHLSSYRAVAIEIWTHAIDGLSENDFILAAKINELPIDLKPAPHSSR